MNSTNNWLSPLALAAFILCTIALLLPVLQWSAIPSDLASQAVYGSAALALGICKLCFYPHGMRLIKSRQHAAGYLLLGFASLLLLISIESSQQLLLEHKTNRNSTAAFAISEIKDSTKEIDALQALILTDSQSQWHNIRARVSDHQRRIDKLKDDRRRYQAEAPAESRFFGGIISQLITAEYLIAICIHIGGILCILALTVWQHKQDPSIPSIIGRPVKNGIPTTLERVSKRKAKASMANTNSLKPP